MQQSEQNAVRDNAGLGILLRILAVYDNCYDDIPANYHGELVCDL